MQVAKQVAYVWHPNCNLQYFFRQKLHCRLQGQIASCDMTFNISKSTYHINFNFFRNWLFKLWALIVFKNNFSLHRHFNNKKIDIKWFCWKVFMKSRKIWTTFVLENHFVSEKGLLKTQIESDFCWKFEKAFKANPKCDVKILKTQCMSQSRQMKFI